MSRPTGEEIARHYLSAHRRIVDLVRTLTPEQLGTAVPATPRWRVQDVLAHLAAIPTDALAGRLQGVPTEEFTAGQVAERRGRSVDELLDEWSAGVDPMVEGARAGLAPANLAVDALTHEHDIRAALGSEPAIRPDELRFCVDRYAFGCGYALKQAGVAPLQIEATDTDFVFVAGIGEPAARVRAPELELFRALSGRRGRPQVAAYEWTGDAGDYLDRFCMFGPLPAAPVPG